MEKQHKSEITLTPKNLDEIRASVDWQAVFFGLGLRKEEKKSKPNDFWGLSPFHDEKTPSFHMSEGGLWYDFSIGEGGGIIELIQKIQGCNCYEAGKFLIDNGWASCSVDQSRKIQAHFTTRSQVRQTLQTIEPQCSQKAIMQNQPIRQDLIKLCTYHEHINMSILT